MSRGVYDYDLLTFRAYPPRTGEVLELLESVPASIRDSRDDSRWILPHYGDHLGSEEEVRQYTTVTVHPDRVVVCHGNSEGGLGRAKKFVGWLLSLGAWELEAGQVHVGPVSSVEEVFGRDWPDPDLVPLPTRSPPITGRLLELRRDVLGKTDVLSVHSDGALSFWRLTDAGQEIGADRRLDDATCARLAILLKRPRFKGDVPGPDGEYLRPVWLTLEAPTAVEGAPKIDAARPPPAYGELMTLLEGWADALASDPMGTLTGLRPASDSALPPRWDPPRPSTDSPVAIGELIVLRHFMGDEVGFIHDHVRIHRSGRATIELLSDDDYSRWDGMVDDDLLARWPKLVEPLWTLASTRPKEILDELRLYVETPKARHEATVDITNPVPVVKELVDLFNRWVEILGKESRARPDGLKTINRTR